MPYIVTCSDDSVWNEHVAMFARENTIHPSHIHIFKPEKDVFTIDMAREVSLLVSTPTAPLLVALYHFESARSETQNALLKTLEESGDRAQIMLYVTESGSLLPTVLSRCVEIFLGPHESSFDTHLVQKYGLMPHEASYVDFLQASRLVAKDEVEALLEVYSRSCVKEPSGAFARIVRLIQTSIWQYKVTHVNHEYLLDYIAGALEQHALLRKDSN